MTARTTEDVLADRMVGDGIKRTIKFLMDRQPELSADEAALYMQRYVDDEVARIKAARQPDPDAVKQEIAAGLRTRREGAVSDTRCTTPNGLARERMAEVGADVDESIRQLSNGPAEPLYLDGLTVESMPAAPEAHKAMVDREIFGPPPVFLAPGPSNDAVMAMRYALDMTRPRLDTLAGVDWACGPSRTVVLSTPNDGTWRRGVVPLRPRRCTSAYRHEQRTARKVRMARKKRRGY